MKTYNRINTTDIDKLKKLHKNLRNLRKRNGNISLFECSGTPKSSYEDEIKFINYSDKEFELGEYVWLKSIG